MFVRRWRTFDWMETRSTSAKLLKRTCVYLVCPSEVLSSVRMLGKRLDCDAFCSPVTHSSLQQQTQCISDAIKNVA